MKGKTYSPIVITNYDKAKNYQRSSTVMFSATLIVLLIYVLIDGRILYLFWAGVICLSGIFDMANANRVKKSLKEDMEYLRIDERGIRIIDEKERFLPWAQIRSITFYNRPNIHMGIVYENNKLESTSVNLQPFVDIIFFWKWKKVIDYYAGREDIITNKHLLTYFLGADDHATR